MVITANGERATATLGSYCVVRGMVGMCADAVYPLRVRGALRVQGHDRITLRAHDPLVKRPRLTLLEVTGDEIEQVGPRMRAKRVAGDRAWFRVRLPADLGSANRVDVFVRYRGGGDADYWAGIVSAD